MRPNEMVRIVHRHAESKDVVTLRFKWDAECLPGQFIMVWVPGAEEVPMSLSHTSCEKGISVKQVGPTTTKLCSLKVGDFIGVRGPYGEGFRPVEGRVLVVGGGFGLSGVGALIDKLGDGCDVIAAARNEHELFFLDRARASARDVWIATDDGSVGFKGNAVQLMRQKLAENEYSAVLACGPERMLYFLNQACAELKVPCQLSLERLMKCGAGLCGSCVVDGKRVCAEGPVFDGAALLDSKEFGKTKRDDSGKIVKL
jgi:dihydroorotate dehydrogenase electron transfer subunit